MYEQLADDLESFSGARVAVPGGSKSICEYIKKAVAAQRVTLEEYLAKFKKMSD